MPLRRSLFAGDHPGYVAGRYYLGDGGGVTTTVVVGAIDTLYFNLLRVMAPITLTGLVCRTGTGGAASSIKMGIWGNSPVSQRPLGAPIAADNTGQATTGSSTNVEAAISCLLSPGWWWVGSKFTGTLPTMVAFSGTSLNHVMRHGASNASLLIPASGITFADTYSNNMPTLAEGASFTQNTTGNHPLIGFKL